MCGRYQLDSEVNIAELQAIVNQLNKDYSGTPMLAAMKTGEISPTDVAPVITRVASKETPMLMGWGFPKWNSSGVLINARSETTMNKALFKSSFLTRRCLIPATGYFEWHRSESPTHKTKYLFRLPDRPMLYMAGLYNFFNDFDGHLAPSFVILTTGANQSVSAIHNRMPLILSGDNRLRWLSDISEAKLLLHNPCSEKLTAERVNADRPLQNGLGERQLSLF